MSNESLNGYIDRLVSLEREKKTVTGLVKDLKQEDKSAGYDPEAITEVCNRILWDEKKKEKARAKAEMARLYAEKIGQLALF